MSVFHRVEDVTTMRADTFVSRARCLMAYDGAVRQEARRQATDQVQGAQDPGPVVTGAQGTNEDALWDTYRRTVHSRFLAPGEEPRQVSVREGIALASRALGVS